jgi:hypothetical protein
VYGRQVTMLYIKQQHASFSFASLQEETENHANTCRFRFISRSYCVLSRCLLFNRFFFFEGNSRTLLHDFINCQ